MNKNRCVNTTLLAHPYKQMGQLFSQPNQEITMPNADIKSLCDWSLDARVQASNPLDLWHIWGGAHSRHNIGPDKYVRELVSYLPEIKAPEGLSVGDTGYPYIQIPVAPTYGRFLDQFNRLWMIIDDYLIFQRYPNSDRFMGGKLEPRNAINNQIWPDDIKELTQKAKKHARI